MSLIAFLLGVFLVIGLRGGLTPGPRWAEPTSKAMWVAVALIGIATAYTLFSWSLQAG